MACMGEPVQPFPSPVSRVHRDHALSIATNVTTDFLDAANAGAHDSGSARPARQALERAFRRGFQALALDMAAGEGRHPTAESAARVEGRLRSFVTDPVIAGMLMAVALDSADCDMNLMRARLGELGVEPQLLLTDFDGSMTRFQLALAGELLSTPPGVPPMSAHFVGRATELREIKLRLTTGGAGPQVLTAVRGWPGVGKTSIAARIAMDRAFVAEAFPDGVLWASVPDSSRITVALASWMRLLQLPAPEVAATSEQMTTALSCALRDRRALLIVDDVWNPAHVAPFRVGGADCALLVTTRLPEVARALKVTDADVYPLGLLSEDAAVELLRRLAPKVVAHKPDESRALVRVLERLPLAVQVAGRLLCEEWDNGWGVDNLLTRLREGTDLLEARAPVDRAEPGHTVPTVRALLRTSTDRLDEETRLRFAYLGAFAPKPATFELDDMADQWKVDDARPTVSRLVARGLLEPADGGRFTMHAVLVIHAKSLLREAG